MSGNDAGHDSENTRERILEAAHRVFLRRGTAGARTQEIADEAGVNKALLHYYFETKERLSEAVFIRAARTLVPPVLDIVSSDLALEEKVRRVVDLEHDVLLKNPFVPAFLISEINHHPDRARALIEAVAGESPESAGRRVLGHLQAQIDERVEDGTLRPIRAEDFVMNLISLCMFPFAMRPLLELLFEKSAAEFEGLVLSRRSGLPAFVISALRPEER